MLGLDSEILLDARAELLLGRPHAPQCSGTARHLENFESAPTIIASSARPH